MVSAFNAFGYYGYLLVLLFFSYSCMEETQEPAIRRRSSVASQHSDTQQHDDAVISRDATSVRRRLPVRAFWLTVGIISLGLGGLGIILPGTLFFSVHILCTNILYWT